MRLQPVQIAVIAATAVSLSACGGGGGGSGVESTPFVPAPPPPPPPPPTPDGVKASQDTEFATVGGDVKIRWDEDSKAYEVMLPGSDWAKVVPGEWGFVAGGYSVDFLGSDKYTYTGFLNVYDWQGSQLDIAYGIPTPASGVPATGTASYAAELRGSGAGYSIGGTGNLSFDFAAGTLAGFLHPIANDPAGWGPYDLGQYDFVNTVYSTGSTSFSGALSRAGFANGSFSGSFTGPNAQELMGKWAFPFLDIYEPTVTVNAAGVMIGKKN